MKIFLLDSNGIICRYFFAMSEMFTEDALNVNGLFGYCKLIRNLIKKHKDEDFAIIAAFDRCSQNFRKEISDTYKSNRKKADTSLVVQLNMAEEFCKNVNIPIEFHLNYEADDIISSIAKHNESCNDIYIISTDKDFIQMVSEKTKILNPFTDTIIDIKYVEEKFGIHPKYFDLYLALCGDSADNIQGIQGVGPKTAIKILNETKDPIIMQKLFPKYNFDEFNKMLSLTKFYTEYKFKEISPYVLNISNFNQQLQRLNFKFRI